MKHDGRPYGVPRGTPSLALEGGVFWQVGGQTSQIQRIAEPPSPSGGYIRTTLFNALRLYWRPAALLTRGQISYDIPDGVNPRSGVAVFEDRIGSDYIGASGVDTHTWRGIDDAQVRVDDLLFALPYAMSRSKNFQRPGEPEGFEDVIQMTLDISATILFCPALAGTPDIREALDRDRAFFVQALATMGGDSNNQPQLLTTNPWGPEAAPDHVSELAGGSCIIDFRDQDRPIDQEAGMLFTLPFYRHVGELDEQGIGTVGAPSMAVEYVSFPLHLLPEEITRADDENFPPPNY